MPLPAFVIPAIMAGAGALGGIGRGRGQQNNTTTSETSQDVTNTGTSSSTAIGGIAPEFQAFAEQLMQALSGSMGTNQLNPALLDQQELGSRDVVNQQSNRLFDMLRQQTLAKGLGSSGASESLARGIAEGARGTGLRDVSMNFGAQRFQMPIQQEQIDNSQMQRALSLFGLLPRSQSTTGETSNVMNMTGTTTGNQNMQASPGFFGTLMNMIAGGGIGLQQGINFNNSRNASGSGNTIHV